MDSNSSDTWDSLRLFLRLGNLCAYLCNLWGLDNGRS